MLLFVKPHVGQMNGSGWISGGMDIGQTITDGDMNTGSFVADLEIVFLIIDDCFYMGQYVFTFLAILFMEKDRELITAEARGDAGLFWYALLQSVGNAEQYLVAGIMSVGIVDQFEMVDVPDGQVQRFILVVWGFVALIQCFLQFFLQMLLIVKTGEWIAGGDIFEFVNEVHHEVVFIRNVGGKLFAHIHDEFQYISSRLQFDRACNDQIIMIVDVFEFDQLPPKIPRKI